MFRADWVSAAFYRGIFTLITALVLAWQNPASAHRFPIFETDSASFETNNGLVWLDLGFTSNHGFESRWLGFLTAAEPFLGYRYAGATDVLGLFTDADIKYLTTHGSDPSINYLVELLQPRFWERHETRALKIGGWHEDYAVYLNNWLLGDGIGGQAEFNSGGGGGNAARNDFLSASTNDGSPPVTPTPLPGSFSLLSITLGCIGLIGHNRRRRTGHQSFSWTRNAI